MKISFVTTLYCSAKHIKEFHRRTTLVAQQVAGQEYEIIFVNDGSPDDSLTQAVSLVESDPHVLVIDLSRNFGHYKAMLTGLRHAHGQLVYLIDSDLEEEPEWLIDFHKEMNRTHCDVVFGVQIKRKGRWFERWSGRLFYALFYKLAGFSSPKNPVTARLMSRRYVDSLLLHTEREISIGGLYIITGFEQNPFPVQKHATSPTTYSLRHKMSVVINSITSFSNVPLIGIFYVGALIFIFASLYTAYLIIKRILFASIISGWTSVMASIWLLGGLIISFIGIIGIYLSKIFSESKQRPIAIVRKVYDQNSVR